MFNGVKVKDAPFRLAGETLISRDAIALQANNPIRFRCRPAESMTPVAWAVPNNVEADAIRLRRDGRDLGWAWSDDEQVSWRPEGGVLPGDYQAELEWVPNSFNSCGPHPCCAGDWPLVSPDQIRGVKDFADAPDAPAHAQGSAWHFRRFRLGERTV